MKTTIAGIKTDFVGTASGCCDTTDKQVHELAEACKFFSLKSCTVKPRIGNAEPRYSEINNGSIQSIGLANRGLEETLKTLAAIKKKYGATVKVKASIAGFSLEENIELMTAFQDNDADFIEVNISCPNTGGKIMAHDFNGLDEYLSGLVDFNAGDTPMGLKLPFYGSIDYQSRIVEIVKRHNIKFITAINSIPGLWIDTSTESTAIAPNFGTGGVGGSCILPFALNECRNYYHLLKGTGISLIGVGGVSSGVDAYRFLLAGCDACEVGSHLEEYGPDTIGLINHTLSVMLKNKGYSSIKEAKGKLKLIGDQNE